MLPWAFGCASVIFYEIVVDFARKSVIKHNCIIDRLLEMIFIFILPYDFY